MKRRQLLINFASKFFSKDRRRVQRMLKITTRRTGPISLRLVESFLSTFVKKNQDTDLDGKGLTGEQISLSYSRNLKAWSKAHFDLFCRKEKTRLVITIDDTTGEKFTVETNDAQLLFFKWFLSLDLDKVILRNMTQILQSSKKTQEGAKMTMGLPDRTMAEKTTNSM